MEGFAFLNVVSNLLTVPGNMSSGTAFSFVPKRKTKGMSDVNAGTIEPVTLSIVEAVTFYL